MANSEGYVSYILDGLRPLGSVRSKRMFGGHGIFLNNLMFALVIDDQLYIKADSESEGRFKAEELERFSYQKQGKTCYINYYQAPEVCLDDPDELVQWGQLGYRAAVRAN